MLMDDKSRVFWVAVCEQDRKERVPNDCICISKMRHALRSFTSISSSRLEIIDSPSFRLSLSQPRASLMR